MHGWIKMHREVFESDIWHDVTTFRLFLLLIGKASHTDGFKYKGMTLNEGQYVRSYRKLAEDLTYKEGRGYKRYSLSTIRACIKKLVDDDRIVIEETELGTLFTIINYKKYQEDESHFNELNPSETPNDNRTEVRTPNEGGKHSSTNIFDEHTRVTPNTLIEEVRTNAELTTNEVRTNAEQDQELKNLRIKELKDTTTTTAEENPVRLFEKLLCRLSHNQMESLYKWQDDFNGQTEIINEAIQIADNKNKRYFGFVEFLLKEWANNNLDSLDRVRAYEQEKFNKTKVKQYPKRGPMRTEMLPDWFDEDQQTPDNPKESPEQIERNKRELEDILKKMRTGS